MMQRYINYNNELSLNILLLVHITLYGGVWGLPSIGMLTEVPTFANVIGAVVTISASSVVDSEAAAEKTTELLQ